MEVRRGRFEAVRYTAPPSRMPNGNEAVPEAMTIPADAAVTASTGDGHRRRNTIRQHATTASGSRCPTTATGSCGPRTEMRAAVMASAASAVHEARTVVASHGRPTKARTGARGGRCAG